MVKLAEKLGENYSQIHRWKNGQQPKFDTAANVISILGGDMGRALPDWVPSTEPPAVRLLGQVQAGAFSPAGEAAGEVSLDLSAWRNSPYRTFTHGETGLVQIVGDSMEPRYSPGEFLVCRTRAANVKELPEGTPCIFTGPQIGSTFKILRKGRKGEIIGQPLNPHHEIIIFNEREMDVQLVVLGSVDLGYTKPIRIPKRRASR